MNEAGCSHVIMEVSSHALKQKRVNGLDFSVAIFTNLTRDHLDYHLTIDDYAQSKQLLFNGLDENAIAIVNMDDFFGKFMAQQTEASVWELSFAENTGNQIVKNDSSGLELNLDGTLIYSHLVGVFNAYNVSKAYLAGLALGVNQSAMIAALEQCAGAIGRLDKVKLEGISDYPYVFVDYAHTPDALENVAKTLKDVQNEGQDFVIVFGCGGNRDAGKRPVMAGIAERFATKVVITSDNPRFENPETILDDIQKGFSSKAKFERITDREQAIEKVLNEVAPNAIVLIAGKGHETYQEVKGVRHPMDDIKFSKEILLKKYSVKENV